MNMDGYENFKNDLMKELEKSKVYEDYIFRIIISSRTNEEKRESITAQSKSAKEGENRCFPLFEISFLYDIYLKDNYSLDAVMRFIDKHMTECDNIFHGKSEFQHCIDNVYDYNYIKDYIILKLINFELNEEYLEDKIYRRLSDLAIVYTIILPKINEVPSTVTIKKDLFDVWNISESKLYQQALKNMDKISVVSTMADIMYNMSHMSNEEYEMLKIMTDGLYTVTNSKYLNGASMFLCNNVQNELAKISKGFYVYPSSIHEMLFQSEDNLISDKKTAVSTMKEITNGINSDLISNGDFLSDNIYYYDAISHTFTIAST